MYEQRSPDAEGWKTFPHNNAVKRYYSTLDARPRSVVIGEIIKIVPAISGRSNCAVTVPAPAGSAGL